MVSADLAFLDSDVLGDPERIGLARLRWLADGMRPSDDDIVPDGVTL